MHASNSDPQTTAITPSTHPAEPPPRPEMSDNVRNCPAADSFHPPTLTPTTPSPIPQSALPNPQSLPLSSRQLTAISLLCSGKNIAQTAVVLHLSPRTLHRWRHEHPAFPHELARRQHDLHDTAARRIRLMLLQAVATVTDELANADYEDRIKVAMSLLRHCDLPSLLAAPTESPNPDHALDQLIRADWTSRNLPPDRDVTDYDRQQYLAHLDQTPEDDHPTPTHLRLQGGTPYPTPDNAPPPDNTDSPS